jgi:predicted phage tail protein
MKNPLKGLGDKLKGMLKGKPEDKGVVQKEIVGGLADGSLIGGFMLVGASFIVPGVGAGAAVIGAALVVGGSVAKYGASKMKTGVPQVTDPSVATPDIDKPSPAMKTLAPDFKVSSEPRVAAKAKSLFLKPAAPGV